jgi:hypothetical protein
MTVVTGFWDTETGRALREMAARHARTEGYDVRMVVGVRQQRDDSDVVYMIEVDMQAPKSGDPRFRPYGFTLRPGAELPLSAERNLETEVAIMHPDDLGLVIEWSKSGLREAVTGGDIALLEPRSEEDLPAELGRVMSDLRRLADG